LGILVFEPYPNLTSSSRYNFLVISKRSFQNLDRAGQASG